MSSPTLGRTIGHGALAGAVAGGAGGAVQYLLVEPSIRAAIALEEAAAGHAEGHAHAVDEVVTRGEQVVAGVITAVVVGTLIGVAFGLAHRYLAHRVSDRSAAGSAVVLAGLGFVSFTLVPALVVPANPPAVGDPATVDVRSLTYVGSIVLAVILTSVVVGLARSRDLTDRQRIAAVTIAVLAGFTLLMWAIPDRSDAIPASVPASLIWDFRIGSLTELAVMWLVLGAAFGWLSTPRETASSRVQRAVATHV